MRRDHRTAIVGQADIAVVTIALLLVRVPARDRATVAMLTAGLVLIAIADTAYAYVTTVEGRYHEAISLGYAWGFLAIGGAALVSRGAPRGSRAQQGVPSRASIVRAVIDLAHVLGVIPVAEGVENAETAARLLEYGCDVAQGYYYCPPLPAPAVLDLLETQHRIQNSRRNGDDPVGGDDYEPDGARRSEIELMQ